MSKTKTNIAASPDRLSSGATTKPAQVLLVEDSPVIRDSLIDLVESDQRCVVSHTSEGEADARIALQEGAFHIAIIDLQLREGSGLNVLACLQHVIAPPLRIVLTNFAEPRMRAQCMALGADYFFDKSREFEQVSSAIDRFLSNESA